MRIAALALLTLPSTALAQEDWPYAALVTSCFDTTATTGDAAACIGEAASICMTEEQEGDTTLGMMTCLMAENQVWDGLLNAEYAKARDFAAAMDAEDQETFPEYAIRADQLRDAQRAWITFRDANCAMAYGVWGAGSMRQIAGADCLLQMTATQTIALRDYHSRP